MSTPGLVCPGDLLETPELAMVAVLDAALQQTLQALLAVHPELKRLHRLCADPRPR